MPKSAAFVPRSYLETPGFFGKHEDVIWKLARNLDDALHLARAREQHELSYQILRLRTEHKNSVQDIATALKQQRGDLSAKLHGHRPATETDLILWAWMVGEERRTFRPDALWAEPFLVPRFPIWRHRDR
jgi:hypothetical protein